PERGGFACGCTRLRASFVECPGTEPAASRSRRPPMWPQVYDPMGQTVLSTLVAALPVVVLLSGLALFRMSAHRAALLGLATALAVAVLVFGMPAGIALATAAYGAAYGLLPIGWIVLNVIFLYQLTEERGLATILRESITGVTRDRRLQLL